MAYRGAAVLELDPSGDLPVFAGPYWTDPRTNGRLESTGPPHDLVTASYEESYRAFGHPDPDHSASRA